MTYARKLALQEVGSLFFLGWGPEQAQSLADALTPLFEKVAAHERERCASQCFGHGYPAAASWIRALGPEELP